MFKLITTTIAVIIIAALLFTLPVSTTKEDIFFTVTVTNNVLNQPKISSVEVDSRPSTILPTSYVLASFYKTGDLTLSTQVGTHTLDKNIGSLSIVDVPLSPKERTVSCRIAGVENYHGYRIQLKEDGRLIDSTEGIIT